jgi:murein DD-endopeptidase MepM/ murein hydrolase activator NlpD
VRRAALPAAAAALALAALASVTGGAGAAEPEGKPSALARSWAIRILVPGGPGRATRVVSARSGTSRTGTRGFAYPADGSVLLTSTTAASVSASAAKQARAEAGSAVAEISIFDGEITADSLTAQADAVTGPSHAAGSFGGTSVSNLQALGRRRRSGRLELGSWGTLAIGSRGVDRSAPAGAKGFHGFVAALDVHLKRAHGGLPAGSEILLGYAEAVVETAPPPPRPVGPPQAHGGLRALDRPQELPAPELPLVGVPQIVTPALDGGPYVFPVYGRASFSDTYGIYRSGKTYHHGDDILGELGQPLVAVATGRVFALGWSRYGGNHLRLRDRQGNEFSYTHLSAFSTLVTNGARVDAGEVIGFMGDTGDAEGLPAHLHFEVHPVSLLFMGYDGAVDPTGYLESWKHLASLAFPVATGWTPSVPGRAKGPLPGAMLVGVSDISSADGLDPGSLLRAIRPRAAPKRSGSHR